MLKTNMEFRKGILFIRLKGDLNKNTIRGLIDKDFKYIVLNIDNMYSIDSYSIDYINKLYKKIDNASGKMIICDKFNISRKLLKNIPKIDREYDAFKLFERMVWLNKYETAVNTCNDLIYWIITKYFKGYEREDLYQVGVLGVIKAYDNYKEDKAAKFSTYAYKYIYGEIYAYINNTKILKISKEIYPLYKKINEAKNILAQKLMKEPTITELSYFLEIEESIIETVINSMNKVDSINKVIYTDGKNLELQDTVKDQKDYYNIDYLMLNEEINRLPEEEQKLIYLRYFEDKTQSEVAKILGISQVGVSRTEQKTLKKIRNNYQNVA